jgi:hypothetical protein
MRRAPAATLLCLLLGGCGYGYPEVAVVNGTNEFTLLRNVSFNGCKWSTVLAFDAATSPDRCLSGDDKVHFEMLDAAAYCQDQVHDGTLPGLCACDGGGVPVSGVDEGLINRVPLWFAYQTVSVKHVEGGGFHLFRVAADDIEQDFSVPGPYGH